MIVMPANNTKWQVHFWQGKYGGLGHLYSPGHFRGPYQHLPYALDNGAFVAYTKQTAWDEAAWWSLLNHAMGRDQKPMWALVPDVVGKRQETIDLWNTYEPRIRSMWGLSLPLAFAVQDGMAKSDVPAGAAVVFVGGTTDWKWDTVQQWCSDFPRVHVGRVNGYAGLVRCRAYGAESCDGTGWFRGDQQQLAGLQRFLSEQSSGVTADITIHQTRRKRSRAKPVPQQIGEQLGWASLCQETG